LKEEHLILNVKIFAAGHNRTENILKLNSCR